MVNKPYLVRVDDEIIINLENVTTIAHSEGRLLICFVGDLDNPLILVGDDAQAMWIYFSSQMMSFQPLKITNPGRETLDIPNSTDEQH
ncbi:hypothetical protein [Nostoc sp. PA-18-2419]|uniref:hypothetical protein n=1 Tax=Nostoc sp. PA-18-2419 TaxID=2575443 RepID=UPI001107C40A|nr:hypothetical protein [Nostoc sp. PA-18-2419]